MVMPIWCVVLVFEFQVSEIVTIKDFVCTQFKKKLILMMSILMTLPKHFILEKVRKLHLNLLIQ